MCASPQYSYGKGRDCSRVPACEVVCKQRTRLPTAPVQHRSTQWDQHQIRCHTCGDDARLHFSSKMCGRVGLRFQRQRVRVPTGRMLAANVLTSLSPTAPSSTLANAPSRPTSSQSISLARRPHVASPPLATVVRAPRSGSPPLGSSLACSVFPRTPARPATDRAFDRQWSRRIRP